MGGKIGPKSRKSVQGGTPKWRQEAKMKKRGGPSNSAALFLTIFEENCLQDGGQNRWKINKKVIKQIIIFYCFFKHHFGRIFNEKSMENRLKNDTKIDPNIIIKADSQNVEILLPVEARSSKTRFRQPSNPSKFNEKSMQKVGSFQDRSWDWFFIDFALIFDPSWEAKSS